MVCAFGFLLLHMCLISAFAGPQSNSSDLYRPAFHFSPEKNWINDPKGLVFEASEYHLFYQYNPFGDLWGHMSWGHAVSKDLVTWQQLPVALTEENGIMIFSGSAVVDSDNTGGFGKNRGAPLVAIYTGNSPHRQTQNVAYSTDHGRTWTQYAGNPVIDIHSAEFRDPMVFWHSPSHHWVMAVSLAKEHKVRFYSSPDLKTWRQLSDFGPVGAVEIPNWECPSIFPLPVANASGRQKWVLEVGVGGGGPSGGSATQYFVGEFDGTKFVNDNLPEKTLWIDYGADFYAAQTWSNVPPSDGRRIMIAWMNNWRYADKLPTRPWRGQMTFPRTMGLLQTKDGFRLTQVPVQAIESIRDEHIQLRNTRWAEAEALLARRAWPDTVEIVAELKLQGTQDVGFDLRKGPSHETRVGYNAKRRAMYIDRTRSGDSVVSSEFPAKHEGPVEIRDGIVKLHILLDRCSVELFGNDGQVAITDLIFPRQSDKGLGIYTEGTPPLVISLDIWSLKIHAEQR